MSVAELGGLRVVGGLTPLVYRVSFDLRRIAKECGESPDGEAGVPRTFICTNHPSIPVNALVKAVTPV